MKNPFGKLYLIPTTLGDNEPLEVLPISVKKIIEQTDTYNYWPLRPNVLVGKKGFVHFS